MRKFEKLACYQTIQAYRRGWRGAWDAFIAALLKQDRLQVPVDIKFSALVRSNTDDAFLEICQATMEEV